MSSANRRMLTEVSQNDFLPVIINAFFFFFGVSD